MTKTIAERLQALGLTLPPAPAPLANYVPFIIVGQTLTISGQISRAADGRVLAGQLGAGLSIEEGQAAARLSALNILAAAAAALGGLERISHFVRLNGFVNSAPGFADQPQVINGASNLIVDVLGERGLHTRTAIGCSGLPANAATEIDAIIQIAIR